MIKFAKFEALINSLYPDDAFIHGRLHNKRMLLLFIELIGFFKKNPDLVPAKFQSELERIKPDTPPEDWLTVCAMRASGRILPDGRYIDHGNGFDFAEAGFEACKAHLMEADKPEHVAHLQAHAIVDCEQKTPPKSLLSFLLKHATTIETLRDVREKTVDLNWLPSWPQAKTAEQKTAIREFVLEHFAFIERQQGFRFVHLAEEGKHIALSDPKEASSLLVQTHNKTWVLSEAAQAEMRDQAALRKSPPIDRHGPEIKLAKKEATRTDGSLDTDKFLKIVRGLGYLPLHNATENWSWAVSLLNKWVSKNPKPACKELRYHNPLVGALADNHTPIREISKADSRSLFGSPDQSFADVHLSTSNTLEDNGLENGECTAYFLRPGTQSGYSELETLIQGKAFVEKHFVKPLVDNGWDPLIATLCALEMQKLIDQAEKPPRKVDNISLLHISDPLPEYVTVTKAFGILSDKDTRDPSRLKEILGSENPHIQFRLNVSQPHLPTVRDYGEAKAFFMDLKAKLLGCMESWETRSRADFDDRDLEKVAALFEVPEYKTPAIKAAKMEYVSAFSLGLKKGTLGEENEEIARAKSKLVSELMTLMPTPSECSFDAVPSHKDYEQRLPDREYLLLSGDLLFLDEAAQRKMLNQCTELSFSRPTHALLPYVHLINNLEFLHDAFELFAPQLRMAQAKREEPILFKAQDVWNLMAQIFRVNPNIDDYQMRNITRFLGEDSAKIRRAFCMIDDICGTESRNRVLFFSSLSPKQLQALSEPKNSVPFAKEHCVPARSLADTQTPAKH